MFLQVRSPPPPPQSYLSKSLRFKHLIVIAITAILTILTLGCPADEDGNIVLDKTQITGSISYQDIQVDYGTAASRTAKLTNITPSNATNSDYLYSINPPLPNGVALNLTNGTITVSNNAPGFSNTYLITATVTGNDLQYKGSVTGSISINIIDVRMQITGGISYQDIQINYRIATSRTVDLSGITPPDAANSDYLYSIEPPFPDGVILNPSDGTIAITTNAPEFSNTYIITATVTENDLQYKGSVTGSISINVEKIQITGGSISYQDIQVDYGTAASSTAQLTGITPPDAANSDYLYSAEPSLPDGVTLNSSDGTITVSNNASGFSNTYTIAATVTENDLQYKGSVTGTVSIKVNHFPARFGHSVVELNSELYLIGGYDNSYYNDVWKSPDGATWTKVTATQSKFSARFGHSVVVFNNELYFIGGSENVGIYKNDVWKSIDGIDWTQVTTTQSKFSERSTHRVVVFNNELYLIGGDGSGNSYYNDVWKSSDGIDWTQVTTAQSKFSGRYGHSVVVFNNELYFIGGYEGGGIHKNDVWKSIDGIDWTQVTTTQPKFSVRRNHRVVVFNNELYLIGGNERGSIYKNDVWKSSDGIDWTQVTTTQSKFSGRSGHRVVVFNNELYFIGGNEGVSIYKNDVWKSSDGIDWEQKL